MDAMHVQSVVFLHDSVHIIGGSEDGTMRKWNCTGRPVGKPWKGKGGSIYALTLSPDGKMIACGRADGSVQRWNTNRKMIGDIWTGHSDWVQSLSWSPSGSHITSGSDDGTILVRKANSGEVEVGPIETNQREVRCLAYSPSGDRIASGGRSFTICIWDSRTGELVVGPIKSLGDEVTSVVWSKDSSKLYSASDLCARVFDSTSGALLHRFQHYNQLFSIALSPKNNILACVGDHGIAQLWDTESYQPLGQPFGSRKGDTPFYCVSFSRNGRYLACGGHHGKFIVRKVEDIVPVLSASILPQQGLGQLDATQQKTPPDLQQEVIRPEPPSSSCLDADATGGDGIIEDMHDDPYNNFFQSSQTSLSATTSSPRQPSNLFSARRFWNMVSRHREPANEPILLRERPKRKFLARLARSNSPPQPPTTTSDQQTPEGNVRAGEEAGQIDQDVDLGTLKPEEGTDEQREGSLADMQSTAKLENIQGKGPATQRPEVVEVSAVRGFQRYVASRKRKKTSSAITITYSPPLAAAHTGGSSQAGSSSQAGPAQACTLLQASSGQGGPSSPATGTQYLQIVGSSSSHTSAQPSHLVTTYHTNHNSDSHSTIESSCNRFLDRICFPRGHYHQDS